VVGHLPSAFSQSRITDLLLPRIGEGSWASSSKRMERDCWRDHQHRQRRREAGPSRRVPELECSAARRLATSDFRLTAPTGSHVAGLIQCRSATADLAGYSRVDQARVTIVDRPRIPSWTQNVDRPALSDVRRLSLAAKKLLRCRLLDSGHELGIEQHGANPERSFVVVGDRVAAIERELRERGRANPASLGGRASDVGWRWCRARLGRARSRPHAPSGSSRRMAERQAEDSSGSGDATK
jgi:hypothetical protein